MSVQFTSPSFRVCSHPRCDGSAQGIISRVTNGEYCSPKCRTRDTNRLKQTRRRSEHPTQLEYERTYKLKTKYGLTPAEWDLLYDQQLGRCAICYTDFAGIKVCVDHDHKTGKVRGLLCVECNHGIGKFKDNPVILRNAAQYLDDGLEVTGNVSSIYLP